MTASLEVVAPLTLSRKEDIATPTMIFPSVSGLGESIQYRVFPRFVSQRQQHQQQPHQQPRRHVLFAEHTRIIPAASPLDRLSIEEVPSMWYQLEDLAAFRQEARELCRSMRNAPEAALNVEQKTCSMAWNAETRGLESRSCLERQRRKYLAGKCVVRAQSKMCPDRLADLAIKCTRWAADLAKEEGARDYIRAHEEEKQLQHETNGMDLTAAAGCKRAALQGRDDLFRDRQVRAKVSA